MEIIERMTGYSNAMMLEYCERLRSVILKTNDIKVGKVNDIKEMQTLKYYTPKEILDRIVKSCEHYKLSYLKEMNISSTFELRDYQKDIINSGTEIILAHGFVYLTMEVRTGKTLTSLGIAKKLDAENVLFITKKKAISSIEGDYNLMDAKFNLKVVNYESLHLVMNDFNWDLIICDEAHSMGAFPKPSNRAVAVSNLIKKTKCRVILLSGTPTPESYSQMYHQVYGIPSNPFREFVNFYKFCATYVKVKQKKIGGMFINDYSCGLETILDVMRPYSITYTQSEAGFKVKTTENVLEVEMQPETYAMIKRLNKDLIIEGKQEVILADTAVKLMMKTHQMYSGTVKFESGMSMILDFSKADFIHSHFKGKKIGIFYKFKEELNALKIVFGDSLTTELSVFEETDKSIALQIVSGREGISLRQADCLVYYNIDFSATSYWQSKDRMTTKERLENDVYWVFAKGGIEHDIYKTVTKKKDYTVSHFKKLEV
jgi:hypothetical protein